MLGAVLAGGESRRYGSDKSDAIVAGVPLVERALEILRPHFVDVVTVRAASAAEAPDTVRDLRPGMGPLAGLEAALTEARGRGLDGVFLLACDLPLVTPSAVAELATAWDGGSITAPTRHGGIEPLCAIYPADCLEAVCANLDSGRLSLHDLFHDVGGVAMNLSTKGPMFLNVNSPDDRDKAEELLGSEDA